jgi:hypothetical protein
LSVIGVSVNQKGQKMSGRWSRKAVALNRLWALLQVGDWAMAGFE